MRFSFSRDVPLEMRRTLRQFGLWLQDELEIDTEVHAAFCYRLRGFFEGKGLVLKQTAILVAVAEGLPTALVTFAHEAVHYEQWREGMQMSERGVDQRAEALVRRWRKSCAA